MIGLVRMKRIRPGTPISFVRSETIAGDNKASIETSPNMTLDGKVIKANQIPILEEFSSRPTPVFDYHSRGEMIRFDLVGDDVGVGSLVDVFFADARRMIRRTKSTPAIQRITANAGINIPIRTIVFDVLVHEELWPEIDPELQVFDTAARGNADPLDEDREIDHLEMVGSVQALGNDVDQLRISEIARYVETIDHICEKMDWERSKFRAYRWRVEYPLIGTQLSMIFSRGQQS
ncbi:MAG: hypothetical protein AAGB34_10415 [Planctomycetota bacterium]